MRLLPADCEDEEDAKDDDDDDADTDVAVDDEEAMARVAPIVSPDLMPAALSVVAGSDVIGAGGKRDIAMSRRRSAGMLVSPLT